MLSVCEVLIELRVGIAVMGAVVILLHIKPKCNNL